MIFKCSLLSLYLVTTLVIAGVLSARTTNLEPSVKEILELLFKFSQYHQKSGERDVHSSESVQEPSRLKPIAAPPPAPALGDWQPPVAWPYPPAPNTGGANEFPLLERFMKSNNIQSNNQVSSAPAVSNWTPLPPQPASAPAPSPAPAPTPVQWSPPKQQNNLNTYLEYGLLRPQSKPMSTISIPPPLDPNEHFHVQHSQNPNQQKHFRLNSVRMADTSEKRDNLNVSFIMPPDMKPLTLNFDTGEVMVDTGDKQQQVERILGQNTASYADLETLIKNARTASLPQSTSVASTGRIENDDDYIVVRHDMNKYAYDLPSGVSVSSGPDGATTSGSQSPQVEKYDVSGHKTLRFTLGRVSV